MDVEVRKRGPTAFDAGPSDGMNEVGLSAHLLYLHGSEHETSDTRPAVSNLHWAQYVLDGTPRLRSPWTGSRPCSSCRARRPGANGHCTSPSRMPLVTARSWNPSAANSSFITARMLPSWHQRANAGRAARQPEALQAVRRNLPMPGDVDPAAASSAPRPSSRTLPKPADTYEAVSHLAGVARNVAVPFGAHDTSGSDSVDTWPTRWATVVDLTHKVFYVMPVNSPAVFWVDFVSSTPSHRIFLPSIPTTSG